MAITPATTGMSGMSGMVNSGGDVPPVDYSGCLYFDQADQSGLVAAIF